MEGVNVCSEDDLPSRVERGGSGWVTRTLEKARHLRGAKQVTVLTLPHTQRHTLHGSADVALPLILQPRYVETVPDKDGTGPNATSRQRSAKNTRSRASAAEG